MYRRKDFTVVNSKLIRTIIFLILSLNLFRGRTATKFITFELP